MILPVSGLTPEGTVFEGEDPAETLAWPPSPRDVVRPAGPMRWRLRARPGSRVCAAAGAAHLPARSGTTSRSPAPLARRSRNLT